MAYKYAYDYDEKPYQPPKLKTNRSMWKLILLNVLTLGFYSFFFFIPFSIDLDKIAPKRDGTKTMNYFWAAILASLTFSVVLLLWFHNITERIEEAMSKRSITYSFGAGTFWGWCVLGSLILVGPFIYYHKLCRAMNLLCEHYNEHPDFTLEV